MALHAIEFAEIAEACGRYDDALDLALVAVKLECGVPWEEVLSRPVGAPGPPWMALAAHISKEKAVFPSMRALAVLARACKLVLSRTRGPLRMLQVLDEHEPLARLRDVAGRYRDDLLDEAQSVRLRVRKCLLESVLPCVAPPSDAAAVSTSSSLASGDHVRAQVFVLRLLGDLDRYHTEVSFGGRTMVKGASFAKGRPSKEEGDASASSASALSWYSKAQQLAVSHLVPWSPLRLASSLNLSVLLFEHQGEEEEAAHIARSALEAATASIPRTAADMSSEAVLAEGGVEAVAEARRLLGLLSENLSAWGRVLRVDRLVV
jgi:hypothetical protein